MYARLILVLVMVVMTGFTACSGDTTATSCASDAECAFPSVCVNGLCSVQECANSGFCDASQVCIPAGDVSVCAPAECGCVDCAPCAEGLTCINGACIQEGTDTCDPACPVDQVCDAGACRPCVGDECTTPADCTVTGCPAGEVCDATAKACVPANQAGACGACTNVNDCPEGGWTCTPLSSGQVCLPPCGSSDDCQTGWTCFNGSCAPGGFSCKGCTETGCPAGQICDTNSGTCTAPQPQCGACTYDWECGAEGACHEMGANQKVCVPRCTGGVACPGGANCITDDTSGYKVCEPKGTTCCFDDDPSKCPQAEACNPACGGSTPHCKLGVCVACLDDSHCAADQTCDTTNGVCSGGNQCSGQTPHYSEAKGACVQCLTDDHCGGSPCNLQTNTCENDVCATCADPYPACAQVNGDFYCVQCTDDSYCGQGGTCQLDTFSCQGGTVTNTDPCASDADCDAGVSGFDLYCDTESGFCIDKAGGCDEITAFCLNGNACIDFFELLGMAGGGGLPGGLPGGGGATLPGSCECTPGQAIIPGLPAESDDCPPGVQCGNFLDLLGGLGGGGGGNGKNVCGGGLPFDF